MRALEAGIRSIFRDPNLSVAADYVSASGTAISLRVLYLEATDAVLGGAALMGTTAEQDAAEILQADVPDKPTRGATLAFDGRTFAIRSSAVPSKRNLTWRVVLTNG